jgi:ribosome-binding factor A
MATHRIERINSLIRQELSELLQRECKDPRLNHPVTVTSVETTQDIRHARVFISSLIDSDDEKQKILDALVSASGFLRRELAERLRLRHVPDLTFSWDDSIQRGAHLLELIDQVSAETKDRGRRKEEPE